MGSNGLLASSRWSGIKQYELESSRQLEAIIRALSSELTGGQKLAFTLEGCALRASEERLKWACRLEPDSFFSLRHTFDLSGLHSGIERDDSGRIVGAKAAIIRWIGQLNSTSAKLEPVKGRGEPVDQQSFEFEGALLNILLSNQSWLQHETGNVSFSSYTNARRSFGDVASVTILGDVAVLGVGYGIVLVYVMVMLGK